MKSKRLINLLPLTIFPSMLIWINIKLAQKSAPQEVTKVRNLSCAKRESHSILGHALSASQRA